MISVIMEEVAVLVYLISKGRWEHSVMRRTVNPSRLPMLPLLEELSLILEDRQPLMLRLEANIRELEVVEETKVDMEDRLLSNTLKTCKLSVEESSL